MSRQESRGRGYRKDSFADRRAAAGAIRVERLEQRALLSVSAGLPPTLASSTYSSPPIASPTQGVVTKFALLAPTNVPNGVPVRIGITAVNASGYPVKSFTGTANVATSDAAATLPASVTFREGRAFVTATFLTPGAQTITITSPTDPTVTGTATTTVAEPLVAAKFGVLLPKNVPNGVVVRGTIVALTAEGRPVPTFSGTVNLSSSDTGATLPASVTLVKGVATFQATFVTAGQQTVSAVDSGDPMFQGTATTTVAPPQVLTSFRLLLKSSTFAGKSTEVYVLALDADGKPMRNFTGPVTLTSSDPAALLPATVNFREGKAEFRVTFNTVGVQTLTATSVLNPAVVGTASTTVATPAPKPRR